MARIFPIIRRIVNIISGGSGIDINAGSQNDADGPFIGNLNMDSLGSENEADNDSLIATIDIQSIGTENEADRMLGGNLAAQSTGTENEADKLPSGNFGTSIGSENEADGPFSGNLDALSAGTENEADGISNGSLNLPSTGSENEADGAVIAGNLDAISTGSENEADSLLQSALSEQSLGVDAQAADQTEMGVGDADQGIDSQVDDSVALNLGQQSQGTENESDDIFSALFGPQVIGSDDGSMSQLESGVGEASSGTSNEGSSQGTSGNEITDFGGDDDSMDQRDAGVAYTGLALSSPSNNPAFETRLLSGEIAVYQMDADDHDYPAAGQTHDGSGNDLDLTIIQTASFPVQADAKFGKGYSFSNNTGTMRVGHPSLRLIGDMTYLVWVASTSANSNVRSIGGCGKTSSPNTTDHGLYGLWIQGSTGQITYRHREQGTSTEVTLLSASNAFVRNGSYQLIGFVRSGNTLAFVVNGVIQSFASATPLPDAASDALFCIGSINGGSSFTTGYVCTQDETRVFSRALSQSEIDDIMANPYTEVSGSGFLESQGDGQAESGSTSTSIGDDAQIIATLQANLGAQSSGSEDGVYSASSSIVAVGHATTVSQTTNAGSAHSWTTPTNAQGVQNDTLASIVAAATAIAADNYNADLKATAFAIGAIPSGFTRTKVELVIKHKWDLTVGALSTAGIVVTVRNSSDTVLATPINRSQGSGDQGTLLAETFDITTAVSGLTDAELQAVRVWCEADCVLIIITGGNASWDVDAIYIKVTYTKSGIT